MQIALDTSTSRPVLAILEAQRVLFEWEGPRGTFHGETLLAGLDQGMRQNNLAWKDFHFISVGIGPGTFTGLRIGVVMAKFLADPNNLRVVAVSSLHAQALSAQPAKLEKNISKIWSLTDAKRHEVYALDLMPQQISAETIVRPEQEFAISPENLAAKIGTSDLLLGEGAENYAQFWPKEIHLAPEEWRYLKAKNIGHIGQAKFDRGESLSAVEIEARYIKTEKF